MNKYNKIRTAPKTREHLKAIVLLSIGMAMATGATSQVKVKAADAIQQVGKQVTICDSVYGIKYLDKAKGQPTFLNIGAAYPKSPFTVVIFGSSRENFSVPPEKLYAGKKICVTGTVQEYNGKAEVVINKPEEVAIQ